MYLCICADRGDMSATSGTNVQNWGHWLEDPGARAVDLRCIRQIAVFGTPGRWKFKRTDQFIAESGHIIETPHALAPGTYLVPYKGSVARLTTDANSAWKLDDGVTIGNIAEDQCRCARYTGDPMEGACVYWSRYFPVPPGEPNPAFYDVLVSDYVIIPYILEKPATRPFGGAPLSPVRPARK